MNGQRPVSKVGRITMKQADKAVRKYLRDHPYTETGLAQKKCVHCGAPATDQWSLRPCAIGRTGWYALCRECDIELNKLTMAFLMLPDAEERLEAYENRS